MPNCYIINYDLRNQKNYDKIIAAIKSYSAWAHVLKSTWAITTDQTAVQVRDYLFQHMDSDDGLLVVKSAGVAAWGRVDCSDNWLKENL